ncbi:MAG: ribosome biogenesis GTP-binding protein YihA/YsxC [Pyramidobacter sp.]|jgi:GTP-binding protein
MILWKATLLCTAYTTQQFPRGDKVEIALAGRSNVGKSSLLNKLVGQKLAHTSAAPGMTRSINFFGVQASYPFTLVDLPGFGFASRSRDERNSWAKMIESYITCRRQLALVIHLVDIRHGLLEKDKELQQWLKSLGVPIQVAFTKADKIAATKRRDLILQYVEKGLYSWNMPLACSVNEPTSIEALKAQVELYLTSALQ